MITLNGNKYNVPSTYKIVMDDKEAQTCATAVIHPNREEYYALTYGNGINVDVTKVVSAALGEEVTIELIDDREGIVAVTDTGIEVTVAQAELKVTKKKKVKEPIQEDEAIAKGPNSE